MNQSATTPPEKRPIDWEAIKTTYCAGPQMIEQLSKGNQKAAMCWMDSMVNLLKNLLPESIYCYEKQCVFCVLCAKMQKPHNVGALCGLLTII